MFTCSFTISTTAFVLLCSSVSVVGFGAVDENSFFSSFSAHTKIGSFSHSFKDFLYHLGIGHWSERLKFSDIVSYI